MDNLHEKWIWLPRDKYADRQMTQFSALLDDAPEYQYTVARFCKTYSLPLQKKITAAEIRVSGDTAFTVSVGDTFLLRGPAAVGGDFLFNETVRPNFYAYHFDCTDTIIHAASAAGGVLSFSALVRMKPIRICEYSRGHGGFYMELNVRFDDGETYHVTTDETWTAEWLPGYVSAYTFDGRQAAVPPTAAVLFEQDYVTEDIALQPCTEYSLFTKTVCIKAGERMQFIWPLDMIYAGYVNVAFRTGSLLSANVILSETTEEGVCISLQADKNTAYDGFELLSAGTIRLDAENKGTLDGEITVTFRASHYPINVQAKTTTSDDDLNRVIDTCTHTLKICRQTHHLDSPKHCEPLACTGDYYVETLMTAASFGDMALCEADVRRTAELLRHHDGRMFHTTYSLIWVQMLRDVYMLTGHTALLHDCEDALDLLLHRFETYLGETGLIETPPDYMFIDWIYPDDVNMHHPPKCLGQTCLNLFCYGALKTAAELYKALGKVGQTLNLLGKAETLKKAIITHLWDEKKQLFIEGLTTPTPTELLGGWMPQNRDRVYYLKQSDILAAYFELFSRDENAALLRHIMAGDEAFETDKVQPYFTHFLLEAVYRNGLRDEFTLPILNQWKAPVKECPKGLVEGFYPPDQTYSFDHSHAWGGTPVWSLSQALTGLKILRPGFEAVELQPSLLGLDFADVEIPTPYGMISVRQRKGQQPVITAPDGISIKIR